MTVERRVIIGLTAACVFLLGVTAWALATRCGGEARSETEGRDLWVATDGDDAGPGTRDEPWATIQHAAETARPGDTVVVAGGTYAERVAIRVSGEPGRPITFAPAAGERVVLDGSSLEVPAERSAMILIDSERYLTVRGFEITGYRSDASGRVPVGILVVGAADHIRIEDTFVHDLGRRSRAETAATPTGSPCSAPRPTTRSPGSRSWATSLRTSRWARPRRWS